MITGLLNFITKSRGFNVAEKYLIFKQQSGFNISSMKNAKLAKEPLLTQEVGWKTNHSAMFSFRVIGRISD